MKHTLSVCFIVKDEEKVLERILKQVKLFADEIVVVDTGSGDKTKEIAFKFTDKVFDFEWCDDFSKARNFSFSKATCEYVMWLDADDFIFPKDIEKIKRLKSKDFDVAYLKYVTGFDEKYRPTFIFERERILRCDKNFKWQEPVHEVITPFGKMVHENILIYHFKSDKDRTGRNLKIYEKRRANGENFSPRAMFYYARELYFNGFYEKAVEVFNEFLKRDAWVENKIEASLNLSNCHLVLGHKDEALKVLFASFLYDLPRAEILCQIGKIYFDSDYEKSAYYYKLALKCKMSTREGGFILPNFYNFTPAIQLCALYYKLGDIKKSFKFHKLSKKLNPNHPSVVYNEKVFDRLLKEQGKIY